MAPVIDLLPLQPGIAFDEAIHKYWVWSERRQRWMQPSSTSQALGISGAKGFNPFYWRKSLMEKHGMTEMEANLCMALHRDGRASIGTELHALIRCELLGGSFTPTHAESLMLLSVWRREFLPQIEVVISCEAPLASLRYFFTGTPDLVARVSGQWLVLDWKSKVDEDVAKPDSGWKLQLSGYELLIEENYSIRLDGAMNLIIWSKGIRDVFYNRADVDQARQKFLGHLAWNHVVLALNGQADHPGALGHLLSLHPEAPAWVDPPQGYSPLAVSQALSLAP